ncbi:hypothetical protein Efla_002289 [Eimeria flavescens]
MPQPPPASSRDEDPQTHEGNEGFAGGFQGDAVGSPDQTERTALAEAIRQQNLQSAADRMQRTDEAAAGVEGGRRQTDRGGASAAAEEARPPGMRETENQLTGPQGGGDPEGLSGPQAEGAEEADEGEMYFSAGEGETEEEEVSEGESASSSSEPESSDEEAEKRTEGTNRESAADGEALSHGCSHYRRKCKVVAPCCNQIFWCRHCHNEKTEQLLAKAHEIDRHAVEEVVCSACETRQPVSNKCVKCGIVFGNYFCPICKFWDDQGNQKKVYHCAECGICRAGGRENYFHCPTCGSCYPKQLQNKHKCLENAMRRQCPVCLEDMFSSLRQSQVLTCGHTIHSHCLRQLQRQGGMQAIRCPMCSKSIADFSEYWRLMREEIRQTPLDDQFKRKVRIVCNDCLERCVTDFHFVGQMCTKCNGFNTRIIEGS